MDILYRVTRAGFFISMGILILIDVPISPILGYVFLVVGGMFVVNSLLLLLRHFNRR